MELDVIGFSILAGYLQARIDVEVLSAFGVPAIPLRRMIEGHYIEMSWELHSYLWNIRDGSMETAEAVISADNEGGIRARFKSTNGADVYRWAMGN